MIVFTKFMKDMLPKKFKAIFLDFDGVVVESTDIKTEAFYEIYLPYGLEIAQKAKEYHAKNQGISRSIKFKNIHELYLNKFLEVKEQEILSTNFSKLVFKKILDCPLVDGIIDFLEIHHNNNIPVFLLSATPDKELVKIVITRKLDGYFAEVYGSPNTKKDAGMSIIDRYNFNSQEILFIGDSNSDYQAALSLNTKFIWRISGDVIPIAGIQYINSFKELI